jgi:hypothetical protein
VVFAITLDAYFYPPKNLWSPSAYILQSSIFLPPDTNPSTESNKSMNILQVFGYVSQAMTAIYLLGMILFHYAMAILTDPGYIKASSTPKKSSSQNEEEDANEIRLSLLEEGSQESKVDAVCRKCLYSFL